jgi:hypothetical protein
MPKAETLRTRSLIAKAANILAEEQPMTVRQLFYRLVSVGTLENTVANYSKVSRILTIARDDERISWTAIVDRSRPEYAPNVWENAGAYAQTIQRSYRKDFWNTQKIYLEVWAEKDAIIGSVQVLTDELGITVRVGRGFQSTTRVHEIAEHFDSIKKPIHIFYLGDWDPSGHEIENDLRRRVEKQLQRKRSAREGICVKRLAIYADDIDRFHLPPLRVKTSDSRAAKFRARFGDECVELDALPPSELRRRIQQAVMRHVDKPSWDRAKRVEAAEKQSIVAFAEKLQGLEVAG